MPAVFIFNYLLQYCILFQLYSSTLRYKNLVSKCSISTRGDVSIKKHSVIRPRTQPCHQTVDGGWFRAEQSATGCRACERPESLGGNNERARMRMSRPWDRDARSVVAALACAAHAHSCSLHHTPRARAHGPTTAKSNHTMYLIDDFKEFS